MNLWFPIFAKIKTDGGLLQNNAISSSIREVAVVIFGIVVIAIGLVIWAGFIRKRRHHLYSGGQRRRRHHHHHNHHHSGTNGENEGTDSPSQEEKEPEDSSSESDHSDRRRRRKYRRRFPTLAQTGGLPPKRPFLDESSDNGNPHAKD